MNAFAKFDKIPSKILKVIKETKRNGHTHTHTHTHTVGRTDNVKTVYPPTNTVCGGYKQHRLCSVIGGLSFSLSLISLISITEISMRQLTSVAMQSTIV